MRFYSFLRDLRAEFDGQGNDLGGDTKETITPAEGYEDVQDEKAQEIIKKTLEEQEKNNDGSGDENEDNDNSLFAGKYKNREDLIKGIANIGNELPEYIINGMSDESLEKHYKELSKNKREEPKTKDDGSDRKYSEEDKQQEEQEEDKETVGKELWEEAESYFNENGGLSNDIYDKLEEKGIPSNIVDKYLDGLKAEQQIFTNEVYQLAGGREQYETIKNWAEDNISKAELDAISSMPREAMLSALEGIKARYEASNNTQSKRIEGNNNTSNTGSIYRTNDEYFKDVSDKRYSSDERFRKSVEDKFSRSKL